MDIGLWIAQVTLLGMYGTYGMYKLFWTATVRQKMDWAQERTEKNLRFIGAVEILGGLGVVVPMLTGILPLLTPLAAMGLAFIQILAILTVHLPRKEFKILPVNIYFLAVSVFVLIGRWPLFKLVMFG